MSSGITGNTNTQQYNPGRKLFHCLSANLALLNQNSKYLSSQSNRQRLNEKSNSNDNSSNPLKGLYEDTSRDVSSGRNKAPSMGPTEISNGLDPQSFEKFDMTEEDANIIKNLDIESAVNNLRKFRKIVKMISKTNDRTDDNNNLSSRQSGLKNNNTRHNHSRSSNRENINSGIERSQSTPRSDAFDYYKNLQNRQKQGNPSQNFSHVRQRERDDSRDRLRYNYTRHGRD
jgi:hypothetical protein